MVNVISIRVANNLLKKQIIEKNQYKKTVYGLEIILSTSLQIIGLILIGNILRILNQIVFITIGFTVLRVFAGGYHANTCLKCFLLSSLMFITGIQIAKLIQGNIYAIIAIIFICSILLKKYSPRDSTNKKLTDKEKILNRKRSLITFCIVIIIFTVIYIVFPSTRLYSVLVITGLFFESLTLLPIFN